MDVTESNYAFLNTTINYDNLSESRHRNDILRQMTTELHIGLCQINGVIKDFASAVTNSIDKQTEALRKRKYVLVDKFYNIYDEIVKTKYDEEKKCFMMFGKNHSWKIFITADMDEYNFERLNTKLSYSELYDTVITLDYLVNVFGIEYSMDLFNSRINTENWEKLDELLNKSKELASEETSKISGYKKESFAPINDMNEKIRDLAIEKLHYIKDSYSDPGVGHIITASILCIFCVLTFVLGLCFNVLGLWIFGLVVGFVVFLYAYSSIFGYYHYKKQGYNPSTIIKQLSEKENELKKELEVLNSNVAQEILNIENEYKVKIKKADSEIKNFVDSFKK